MSFRIHDGIHLPRFAHEMLSACPATGGGVHLWLFRMARVLHPFFEDKGRMADLLAQASAGCGREVPESEILAAIANSQACAWQPRGKLGLGRDRQPVSRPVSLETASPSFSSWPQRNDEQIEAVVAASDVAGLADLWEASPVRPDWEEPQTEELIDRLFPGNPLLCCGKHINRDIGTGTREEWRGQLAVQQFIVPSPMTAEEGSKKSGTGTSVRCLDNTGPRRYLVIEFDQGTKDTHAVVLWHLARLAPLVMVVHSGGKSLHGWFACQGSSEALQLRFMRYAVMLGADPATWTRCQFVRMPDGLRRRPSAFGVRQSVFYFNPNNLP
jgi:hypothetical protein